MKRSNALGAGAAAAALMALVLWYTLFSAPALGAPGNGYGIANTLDTLRLTPLFETDGYTYPLEGSYAMQPYNYADLLRPGTPTIAYAAALARPVLTLLGRPFTAAALAWVYVALLSLGAGLAVAGVRRYGRVYTCWVGAVWLVLASHNAIAGYLHSFYQTGAVLAFGGLFLGCLIWALCQPAGCGWPALLVLASGGLFLKSKAQMVVFLPALLAAWGLTIWHTCPRGPRRSLHGAVCLLALLPAVMGGVEIYQTSVDIHAPANNHLAVFQGYLPTADDPSLLLKELGLDDSWLPDVGRSYYEPDRVFAHNPRAQDAQWMENISAARRVRLCLRHPDIVKNIIADKTTWLYDPHNARVVTADGQQRYQRPSLWTVIWLFFQEEGFARQTGYMLAGGLVCLGAALLCGLGSGAGKGFAAAAALCTSGTLYLPACVALTGTATFDMDKVLFFAFGWASLFAALGAGTLLVSRLVVWLSDPPGTLRPLAPTPMAYTPLRLPRLTAKQCGWLCGLLGAGLLAVSLLPQVHIGGVNNGDFGRMMHYLGLYWRPEQLTNSEQQLAWGVVEQFDSNGEFRAAQLTSLDPTYSLAYPAALTRGISWLIGRPYSTRIQGLLLGMLVVACLVVLVKDLYKVIGSAAVLPAVLLPLMTLGENYVAWFNSFFGESTVLPGLMLLVACAVHLITQPPGFRRALPWLLGLAFAVRFLACSKAQMVLALPGGLVLLVTLAWYHRPRALRSPRRAAAFGALLVVLCGWNIWNAVGIFTKNSQESDRQTVWSSVFFGALMVTDDPLAAMEELGIDPALAQDIGKNAYWPEYSYAYPFNSPEMDEAFFDRVSTMTMVKFYLAHPKELWFMLNRAAQQSVELHTGFMAYTGEVYAQSAGLHRTGVWRALRPLTAGGSFLWYLVVYGGVVLGCLWLLTRPTPLDRRKLFAVLVLCIMAIGVFQYPLSVVGNGFADNNKQLYGFMLCHDLLVIAGLTAAARWLVRRICRQETALTPKEELHP